MKKAILQTIRWVLYPETLLREQILSYVQANNPTFEQRQEMIQKMLSDRNSFVIQFFGLSELNNVKSTCSYNTILGEKLLEETNFTNETTIWGEKLLEEANFTNETLIRFALNIIFVDLMNDLPLDKGLSRYIIQCLGLNLETYNQIRESDYMKTTRERYGDLKEGGELTCFQVIEQTLHTPEYTPPFRNFFLDITKKITTALAETVCSFTEDLKEERNQKNNRQHQI